MLLHLRWFTLWVVFVSGWASAQDIYFYSLRNQYSSTLLPVGFDLREAGLVQASGAEFPAGLQFLYASSISLPLASAAAPSSEALADYLSAISQGWSERFHFLLTAEQSLSELETRGQRFPTTVAELEADPDAQGYFGPWTVWLDAEDTVASLTAPRTVVSGAESRVGSEFYTCAEDGKVVSSYSGGYYLSRPEAVRTLAEDCLGGRITPERVALPLEGAVPDFALQGEGSEALRFQNVAGSPFALLILPSEPDEDDACVPRDILAAAERLLQSASVPLYVVALPVTSPRTGERVRAEEAAAALRDDLAAPVYADVDGRFTEKYGLYLPYNANLLLFDADGRVLDNFTPYSDNTLAGVARSLQQALLELGLF